MALAPAAALRAATALLVLAALAGCEGALGTSPPHAAPANPSAEGSETRVELDWDPVTDATSYVILWDNDPDADRLANEITGIEETEFSHTGLVNDRLYRYRIVAATSGGRGPESVEVSAEPGLVPGRVEWVAVTTQASGQTVHFAEAEQATAYRVYFASLESQLEGRRPTASFEVADGSPHVRSSVAGNAAVLYRVIAVNDSRLGTGGPIAMAPVNIVAELDLDVAGSAFGLTNDDDCYDLPTATGALNGEFCSGGLTARELDEVGLDDLLGGGRKIADVRIADLTGDGLDDLFSSTSSEAGDPDSIALLHVGDDDGNFTTSAEVSALAIGGVSGTVLTLDFDNDGDLDVFVPHDQTRGDGARNWLLRNDGGGEFTDIAAAAGVELNPAGEAYVPGGGQAVDFNEDGFVDLLFGSRLLVNGGDGTFSDGSAAVGIPVRGDQGLELMDVDLDGDLDLIHDFGGDTRLHRNAGGLFDAGEILDPESGTFSGGLAVCDVNTDGFEDVLVASNDSDTSRGGPKLLVNVAGELMRSVIPRGTTADPDSLLDRIRLMSCGDVDRDGTVDILAHWGTSYRLLRNSHTLTRTIRLRIVGADGERNQQGRIVRVVPRSGPTRIMTRVVESGSGLRSQNMYDLVFGAPWTGTYDVTVGFADGEFTTTAVAGDDLQIAADGTITDLDPPEE